MNCYICSSKSFFRRKGTVRDNPNLEILECKYCGLVTLSSFEHITDDFYKTSGMHKDNPISMESWLRDCDRDDQRRIDSLKDSITNKKILDYGCGAGGFINKALPFADEVAGIEPELRVQKYWGGKIDIYSDIDSIKKDFDLITAFHTIEHLKDPVNVLKKLATKLAKNGKIVIEVPSSQDALLTLYESCAFQKFTYWSQHLFLFNPETMRRIVSMSGLRLISIGQYQRYPLANHLFWLSRQKPGGHKHWDFMNNPALNAAYHDTLASLGLCDTLVVHMEAV